MATPTRPTTDQVRFHSSKTGTHILDKYIEDIEQGNRTLADMIGELFDTNGDLSAFEFRLNNNAIEYKIGTGPWTPIHDYSAFRQEVEDWANKTGATVNGDEYSAKEYATGTTVSTGSAKSHADAASTSASSAATSETNAAASESAAATSASNAATSETNAAASASAASTSESAAATSATNAAASASAASTSETNAAASASEASTSETNAAASEADAEAARDTALTYRDAAQVARNEAQTAEEQAQGHAEDAAQYATQTAANQGPDNNPIAAGLEYAIQLAGQSSRQIFDLRETIIAQRTVFLKNKYVVQGFKLTKTDSRDLDLSETGTVGSGRSKARLDGTTAVLNDQADAVAVPTNSSGDPVTKYAYLYHDGSAYTLGLGDSVPEKGLLLYRLEIPAGDTSNDLSNVTLVDERVIQSVNSWTSSFRPTEVFGFPYTLPRADYGVSCDVLEATNKAAVGELIVFDRTTNGAKLQMTGTADNVRVRVTLLNPNYQ